MTASIVTGFSLKSSCCGADVYTRTDRLGRAFECCAKCDTLIPRAQARLPDRAPASEPPPPAAPRPTPAAVPPTSEPSMAKIFEKKCLRSGRPFKATGPAGKFCGTCPECKKAAASPPPSAAERDAPAAKKRVNTGFKAEPPRSADNVYQPTIDALREELDGLEARRRKLTDAMAHLESLGAA